MRTALAFWRRSQVPAATSALVLTRPDQIDWVRITIQFVLGLILAGNSHTAGAFSLLSCSVWVTGIANVSF